LLLEEQVTQIIPVVLEALGLGRREAEVLYWLIQGKTNPEIGSIMQLRPSTVQTHVLRIYQKLGVETHMAAAMHALESLGLVRR
jgi:DNA-binding CsgD family transcriptional regulator